MSQVIYDGTFAGAATSGGTINDTCSVGTASAWIDANASWHMDGSAHLLPNTGLSYSSTPLKRPAGESYRDVNVSAIISTTAGTAPRGILLFARINGLARVGAHMVPGAQSAFYYWDSAGAFSAVNFANGPTLTAGHRYK